MFQSDIGEVHGDDDDEMTPNEDEDLDVERTIPPYGEAEEKVHDSKVISSTVFFKCGSLEVTKEILSTSFGKRKVITVAVSEDKFKLI